MEDKIRKILEDAGEQHLYRVHGDRESYDQYNNGWQSAVDFIESRIETLLKEVE